MTMPQTQSEQNKAIARRWAQVWAPSGLGIVDELAAPDLMVAYPVLPEPLRGPAAFKVRLTQFYVGIPDVTVSVEDVIAEGDQVALRWTFRGTHQGALAGIPPTGRSVAVTAISIYRIANGKVVEEIGVEDALGLLQQLGVLPTPGQAGTTSGQQA